MWPFRPREPVATRSAEVADLVSEVRALRRDLDDLDETFRRYRSRRAKQDPVDVDPEQPTSLPTLAQLRASGRSPFGR